MPTLKTIMKKWKGQLKSDNEFRKQRSIPQIFHYLWDFNARNSFQLPEISVNISKKSSELSEAFRNEGNRLYRQKKLPRALEAYNLALIAAPHPAGYNNYDNEINEFPYESEYSNGEFSHLAYAYANRSALLYELNEYDRALSDIAAATACGYPSTKQHKLWERRIKCLISLENFKEAHIFALMLETKIENVRMDAKELKTFRSDLQKLITKCCNTEKRKNDVSKNETTKSRSDKDTPESLESSAEPLQKMATSTPQQSKITLSVQAKTSRDGNGNVSSAIGIQFSEYKGRHLVALRDIDPGEVLLTEDSHVCFVRLNGLLRTHCSHCLRRVRTPAPCPTCSLVVFCNSECRTAAGASRGGHASECELLPKLVALQPDLDALLALRALTALGWHKFSENAQQIKNNSGLSTNMTDHLGSTTSNKSDTSSLTKLLDIEKLDYEFLISLEGNISCRSTEELIEAGMCALVLLSVLISNAAFWRSEELCTDPTTLQTSEIITLGCHLMVMMLKIQCNAHCVKELAMTGNEPEQRCSYLDVGYGLYQKLSLLNHACNANAHQSNTGKQKILYSISTIKRGEEITISYGERFASHGKKNRIASLKKAYSFTCNCRACENDWPLFQDLPIKFSFRCAKCSSGVDPSSKKCKSCLLEHSTGGDNANKKNKGKKAKKGTQKEGVQHTYDVTACSAQISNAWRQYNDAFKNVEKGATETQDLKKITELISLMDKYAHMPNRPYIEAQETCIRWFDVSSMQFKLQ